MEMTALHWACQNGHVQVVKALLEYGANKDLANKFGLQPVDIANQIGRFDIANLLERDRYVDPAAAAQNLTVEMTIDDAPPMNNNAVLVEDVDESCMTIGDLDRSKVFLIVSSFRFKTTRCRRSSSAPTITAPTSTIRCPIP